MGLLSILHDTSSGILVKSLDVLDPFQIGNLYQENNLAIDYKAIKRLSTISFPLYQLINLTGFALTISVGTAGSPLASQATWTLNAAGDMLSGSLNLNVAGINALADGASLTFEVILHDANCRHSTQQEVRLRKAVMMAADMAEPALDVGLGVEEAKATYLPRNDLRSFTAVSQDGTKRFLVYFHNDGSLRTEEIT